MCYNQSRDVMSKIKINVYKDFNNIKENEEFFAIMQDNVIKYIDFADNKMIIDINNNYILRENGDFAYNIDFNKNIINIVAKKLKKEFNKNIKTILLKKTNNAFLVKYHLIDEDVINEFYIKY